MHAPQNRERKGQGRGGRDRKDISITAGLLSVQNQIISRGGTWVTAGAPVGLRGQGHLAKLPGIQGEFYYGRLSPHMLATELDVCKDGTPLP